MTRPLAHARVASSRNSHNAHAASLNGDQVPHDLLTTREVAEMFRTTESTVRYWRHTGTGPEGHRYGRKVLYARRAVDHWMRTRQELDAGRRPRRG